MGFTCLVGWDLVTDGVMAAETLSCARPLPGWRGHSRPVARLAHAPLPCAISGEGPAAWDVLLLSDLAVDTPLTEIRLKPDLRPPLFLQPDETLPEMTRTPVT